MNAIALNSDRKSSSFFRLALSSDCGELRGKHEEVLGGLGRVKTEKKNL